MSNSRKPRVLLATESTFLSSGYGTYGFEVMKRLHASGEFELCELGSFGRFEDDRILDLPWQYVGVVPNPKDPNECRIYESNFLNKFGAHKFDQVCLDFEPDIVFSFRDWFNDEHQGRSPFRKFFHYAHMPTCDAIPLNEQWLATYTEADAVFAYTDWGLEVLRQQGSGHVNTICSAPPGADTEVFKRIPNKKHFRQKLHLPEDCLVIGSAMRNQVRKLFPDLIEVFARFLKEAPEEIRNKTYLYLHTAYPDNGWDFPRLLREYPVGHRTLFTYVCRKCDQVYPSHFQDVVANCHACGEYAAVMPDSSHGISRERLAQVYNTWDCHVQYATNEGFGMPMVEAASCELPVFAVDYSAMSDVVRKVKGVPVKVQRLYREPSTHRLLAMPDNNDLFEKLVWFLSLPESLRLRMGWQARKGVLEHYTYDRTAGIWANHFRSVPLRDRSETWSSKPRFHTPNTNTPEHLSNDEWVRWCFANVMGQPDQADSYTALKVIKELNWGSTTGGSNMSWNDASVLGHDMVKRSKFTRKEAMDQFLKFTKNWNYWEQKRAEKNQ